MIVIGLTGSIGMGKSTVAAMFRDAGVPVFDADAAVHRLYAPGGAAVAPVGRRFSGVVVKGAVDRTALSATVMGDAGALRDIEAIVHPLVRTAEDEFLEKARAAGAALAVIEIPLLYETGGETRVDFVAVVSAPAEVQRRRVLARPGMSEAKLAAILARQMPDDEKRRRADHVIDTGLDLDETARQVDAIIARLTANGGNRTGEPMREIVLDTETTGLDPSSGDRIVEIGCLELINHVATGRTYHCYINPERDMPAGAFAVHGLSAEFLSGHPVFAKVADDFLEFIATANLVIHNAAFDIGFINHEIARLGRTEINPIAMDRVVDTLALARRKHPFGPNSLDALCRRYSIDNSGRTLHGALLDCELLAEVYLELIGGRQPGLGLAVDAGNVGDSGESRPASAKPRPTPLPPRLTPQEAAAHAEFVATLGDNALWREYDPDPPKGGGD